jgi:hypothetical protein
MYSQGFGGIILQMMQIFETIIGKARGLNMLEMTKEDRERYVETLYTTLINCIQWIESLPIP